MLVPCFMLNVLMPADTQVALNANQEVTCNGRKWRHILIYSVGAEIALSTPILAAGLILGDNTLLGVASGLIILAILTGLATLYCFPCTRFFLSKEVLESEILAVL